MTPVVPAAREALRPRSRLVRGAVVLALLTFLLPTAAADDTSRASGEGNPRKGPKPAADPGAVEVRFTDNSVMRLTLKDESIELITEFGRLSIPVARVQRVEFGLRISDETAKRIEVAIANLGAPNFRTREAAGAELLSFKEKAYHALQKAAKNSDMEVSHRAEELLNKIREAVPEEVLNTPAHDVIHTDDSKIAGKISAAVLKVSTAQFGEQQMRLADVRSLKSTNLVEPEADVVKNVMPDPGQLKAFEGQVGKTFHFRVTGAVGGSVWGTDIYTTDTTLASAAVHAGVLQVGQTAVIKVTMIGPQAAFQGSVRNGVTSANYANYPGSYRVHK